MTGHPARREFLAEIPCSAETYWSFFDRFLSAERGISVTLIPYVTSATSEQTAKDGRKTAGMDAARASHW
jgi:hypothetical protein